jgi:hypothetical protein
LGKVTDLDISIPPPPGAAKPGAGGPGKGPGQ